MFQKLLDRYMKCYHNAHLQSKGLIEPKWYRIPMILNATYTLEVCKVALSLTGMNVDQVKAYQDIVDEVASKDMSFQDAITESAKRGLVLGEECADEMFN